METRRINDKAPVPKSLEYSGKKHTLQIEDKIHEGTQKYLR